MQPVIKWSGSKRSQANDIVKLFPNDFNTYYEPFIGGGSVLYTVSPFNGICGDICTPLIALWNEIKERPLQLAESYKQRWQWLQDEGQDVYYTIRDRFNRHQNPEDFLFITRTCTNGLIRFNKSGEFNNSFHITRKGIFPSTMQKIILDWSQRIQRTQFINSDYHNTLSTVKKGDIVYLDPPYENTKGMYYGRIDYNLLWNELDRLNSIGVKYILSFDGIRGGKNILAKVPEELYVRHELIKSGVSSFDRVVNGKYTVVYESVYLNYDM